MARIPRQDGPGTWHHVMNRGVAKRPLFEDREDQRFFLARLARQVRLGCIEVHAFCLMTTHFHMLVHSPTGKLSEAMRRVQNEHSRQFNRRHKRDGTLIRGRYFSKPVLSLSYRQTLVSYIDANPVKAGMVRISSEYAFGSAKAYMQAEGPRWLTRGWVESVSCATAGSEHYTPAAYIAAFGGGLSSESAELIHARIASTATEDPLDDLIAATPKRVREWMQRKALLADGCRIGLPVCGLRALDAALAESVRDQGPWFVEDGRSSRRGAELARAGLLRDLCGLHWHAIAGATGGTEAQVRRQAKHHWRLIGKDATHAERAACVAKSAVMRCSRSCPRPKLTDDVVRYQTVKK